MQLPFILLLPIILLAIITEASEEVELHTKAEKGSLLSGVLRSTSMARTTSEAKPNWADANSVSEMEPSSLTCICRSTGGSSVIYDKILRDLGINLVFFRRTFHNDFSFAGYIHRYYPEKVFRAAEKAEAEGESSLAIVLLRFEGRPLLQVFNGLAKEKCFKAFACLLRESTSDSGVSSDEFFGILDLILNNDELCNMEGRSLYAYLRNNFSFEDALVDKSGHDKYVRYIWRCLVRSIHEYFRALIADYATVHDLAALRIPDREEGGDVLEPHCTFMGVLRAAFYWNTQLPESTQKAAEMFHFLTSLGARPAVSYEDLVELFFDLEAKKALKDVRNVVKFLLVGPVQGPNPDIGPVKEYIIAHWGEAKFRQFDELMKEIFAKGYLSVKLNGKD